MSTTLVRAKGGGRPFVIRRNGGLIVLSRLSTHKQRHDISFTPAELLAVTNALVDAAEQLEQDNK